MKIKRKVIFFVALMSLFYCITFMQDTYAKYVSSASANTTLTIARWNILVNSQDIIQNSDFSSTIQPQFNGTTYIKSGVIAPTSQGTFAVTLNGTNTDVSFTYTISVDENEDNTVTDLKITKYVIDNVEYTYNGNNITGNILFNDAVKTKTITFYVEWDDNTATETMDNSDDSDAANGGVAALDVNVNVIQMH